MFWNSSPLKFRALLMRISGARCFICQQRKQGFSMSSIRLLLLGVLLRKQPIHGYDVRRELEQWHADRWANIAYGSIYSALGKMADEGLVEATNADQSERQSARTEYTITERGKAEFEHLLHEYWWELKPTIDPFQIALTF